MLIRRGLLGYMQDKNQLAIEACSELAYKHRFPKTMVGLVMEYSTMTETTMHNLVSAIMNAQSTCNDTHKLSFSRTCLTIRITFTQFMRNWIGNIVDEMSFANTTNVSDIYNWLVDNAELFPPHGLFGGIDTNYNYIGLHFEAMKNKLRQEILDNL